VSAAAPVGFTVTLPDSWFELDVNPRTRDARIRALVEQQIRDQPQLWEQRAALVRMLRRQARDAHDAGAIYCACFVMAVEQSIIPGSMMLMVLPTPPGGGGDAIAEALPTKEAKDDDDTWMTRSIVTLPRIGRVPRSQGVTDVDLPDGQGSIRTIIMQTFLPLDADRLLMVACASPALDLAEPLLELFDVVTASVSLVDASVLEA
jgi:hypothetical protein